MATLTLSAITKVRPLASVHAFQLPSKSSTSFLGRKQWASSVAYGRTTFRHMRGDITSWRMTASPEESSSAPSVESTSSTTLPDLEQYQNENNLDDQVFSAMSADGGIKVTVATMRNLLNEMMIQHTMNPVPGGEYIDAILQV